MKSVFLKCMVTVSYNRQLRVNIRRLFVLAQALEITRGFGRSRIRRNCGYTLLWCRFFIFVQILNSGRQRKIVLKSFFY